MEYVVTNFELSLPEEIVPSLPKSLARELLSNVLREVKKQRLK